MIQTITQFQTNAGRLNCGFFKDVRTLSGTLNSSTGNTTVCDFPSGYTPDNIIFLALLVETATDVWRDVTGYDTAAFAMTSATSILISSSSSSLNSKNYRLIIAHL